MTKPCSSFVVAWSISEHPPRRRERRAARLKLLAKLVATLAWPVAALAQTEQAERVEIQGRRYLDSPMEPGSTLRGPRLANQLSGTLGATLQDELGVANASFGPGVGLPLIRGQGGSRVRAMVGGLGTHDASTVSADHGVMVEPGTAESITVWRGPATIRFGGSAIGGAVEIEEGRVPDEVPQATEVQGSLRAGTGNSFLGVVRVDGPVTGHWAWHADLHGRKQGTVRIGGWAIDEDAVRQQFQLVNAVNTEGYIGNSDSHAEGGAAGLGYVDDFGSAGWAVSELRQDYGVPPGGHSHVHAPAPGEPAVTDTDVRIRARLKRLELRAERELPSSWGLEGAAAPVLRFKAAHVDYRHDETEGGRLSTTFTNKVDEARVELDHHAMHGLSGTVGVQAQQREFSALGEEAFVPRTDVRSAALFALQRWEAAPWNVELGLRVDRVNYEPQGEFPVLGVPRDLPDRSFNPRSASLALQRRYGGDDGAAREGSLTLTHWRVGRAPDVQELYAGGPHLATRTFDFGNTALDIEEIVAWDLAWVHRQGPIDLKANVFAYRSDNYIYQRTLGWFYEMEEKLPQAVCARLDNCLPATKREQTAAKFRGYELEVGHTLLGPLGSLRTAIFSDATRGTLSEGGDVPRLPPQRYGLAATLDSGPWQLQGRLTRGRKQSRPGDNETPTAAYVRFDSAVRWTSPQARGGRSLTVFVVGRNLGDQNIRNSTSFLRNYAPEPGRSIELGVEVSL